MIEWNLYVTIIKLICLSLIFLNSFLFLISNPNTGELYYQNKLLEEKSMYTIIYEHNKRSQMLIYS